MYNDVWSFNLDSHQWKKMAFELITPLFFHDAAITKEGCLLVWGGVLDRFSTVRTNSGQYCYLEPPSLKTLAAQALRPYVDYKTTEEANQLRISRVTDLVLEICGHLRTSASSISNNNFGGCQLYFASTDDLIAHIEFTHITPLEDEYRQKISQTQCCPEENRASATPNMPLSCVYRLFRMPYNPQPCGPDVVRITFNHYRKRQLDSNGTSVVQNLAASTPKKEEPPSVDSNGEDLSECGPNEQEDRYCCMVSECQKRFRTGSGLRLHSRTAHGVVLQENILCSQSIANGSGSRLSSQNEHLPVTVSPTKYAASRPYKCHQCSKRYKTTAGLSNHVDQSHRKQTGGCGTPSSTDSSPASPSAAVLDQLISQARAHGQATAAAQEQQRVQQRPLPVQVASSNSHQYGQVSNQAPLPVRSLPSTHQRYSHGPVSFFHSLTSCFLFKKLL
uniref:C2H2-type domain-containing protein n=1 Tax=Angiostrongylus cantonensis TaxID=6313 RepID=A0A0K0DQM8_ANGCA